MAQPMNGAGMIRLLVVEEQPSLRKGLYMRLTAESDLTVIGETSSCEAALELASQLCPDIVLVDTELSGKDAFAAPGSLRLICQRARVVILSMNDDALARARAAETGAVAFVGKAMPADTLLTVIRQVAGARNMSSI
jgi:DNA-binding NarL/FixJ family response regulator